MLIAIQKIFSSETFSIIILLKQISGSSWSKLRVRKLQLSGLRII